MLVGESTNAEDETVIQLRGAGGDLPPEAVEIDLVHRYYIQANRSDISNTHFSLQQPGYTLADHPEIQTADLVNLHWVSGIVSPETARQLVEAGKILVWTFHDMRQITGGCHYPAGCERFMSDCSPCPQLLEDPCDLTRTQLQAAVRALGTLDWTAVCPSRWLAGMVRKSRFGNVDVQVIANGLDQDSFHPLEVPATRKALGLDPTKAFLCVGSQRLIEKRKGLESTREVLRRLARKPETKKDVRSGRWQLICFGFDTEKLEGCGWRVNSFSYVESEARLCQLYSASNALLVCSFEDNLPNTVMEAMSCGCPAVSFDVGGCPDLIDSGINGYLAPAGDSAAAAEFCGRLLAHPDLKCRLGLAAREKVHREFTVERQAKSYLELYERLVGTGAKSKEPFPLAVEGQVRPVISFSQKYRRELLLVSLRNAHRDSLNASKTIKRLAGEVVFWKFRAPRYWAQIMRNRLRTLLARRQNPPQT
jgi:glycosyltransferase involved in cell wall biosynthesis